MGKRRRLNKVRPQDYPDLEDFELSDNPLPPESEPTFEVPERVIAIPSPKNPFREGDQVTDDTLRYGTVVGTAGQQCSVLLSSGDIISVPFFALTRA